MENQAKLFDYDLLVIGGGSGGLAVAKEAAGFQKRVLILDIATPSPKCAKDAGDSHVNAGNVKKLLHQACLLGKAIQDSKKYGWKVEEKVSHVWSELVDSLQEHVISHSLELRRELRDGGVTYLSARGEIVAPHTVEATAINGRKSCHTAETLVIATGDKAQYLGIPGGKEHCVTSDDLLSLRCSPASTLVVGGTAEGLECAGFLSGLGLEVTVLHEPGSGPLPAGYDQKMAQKIQNHMFVHGVNFIHHYSLIKVEQIEACSKNTDLGLSDTTPGPGRLRVSLVSTEGKTKQEEFDTVLLAVGRESYTRDLGLERVGVKCSQEDTGRILVNEQEQTSVDHVYALGSVQHGRPSTTGLSMHAGRLLARRLYAGDTTVCHYDDVPTVLFTPLEYAACGLSEERANLTFGETNIEVYHSYYWPLEWTLPGRNKNSCYVKIICHIPGNERVVGLHVMGPSAGDIVQGFAAAMKCGLTKQQLDSTVGIHPLAAQQADLPNKLLNLHWSISFFILRVLTTLTVTQRTSEAMMVRGNC